MLLLSWLLLLLFLSFVLTSFVFGSSEVIRGSPLDHRGRSRRVVADRHEAGAHGHRLLAARRLHHLELLLLARPLVRRLVWVLVGVLVVVVGMLVLVVVLVGVLVLEGVLVGVGRHDEVAGQLLGRVELRRGRVLDGPILAARGRLQLQQGGRLLEPARRVLLLAAYCEGFALIA